MTRNATRHPTTPAATNVTIDNTKPTLTLTARSFAVTNEGQSMHGLAIVKGPAKAGGGMLDESAFLAHGKERLEDGSSWRPAWWGATRL